MSESCNPESLRIIELMQHVKRDSVTDEIIGIEDDLQGPDRKELLSILASMESSIPNVF